MFLVSEEESAERACMRIDHDRGADCRPLGRLYWRGCFGWARAMRFAARLVLGSFFVSSFLHSASGCVGDSPVGTSDASASDTSTSPQGDSAAADASSSVPPDGAVADGNAPLEAAVPPKGTFASALTAERGPGSELYEASLSAVGGSTLFAGATIVKANSAFDGRPTTGYGTAVFRSDGTRVSWARTSPPSGTYAMAIDSAGDVFIVGSFNDPTLVFPKTGGGVISLATTAGWNEVCSMPEADHC